MKKRILEIVAAALVIIASFFVPSLFTEQEVNLPNETPVEDYGEQAQEADELTIDEDGLYYTKEDVALYIHTYGRLPDNYITKTKAQKLGWKKVSYDLWEVADGKVIGGGTFENREGLLPSAEGRTWKECDVNYYGGDRGDDRLVYSNDGLVYFTTDHYESFEVIYGEETIRNRMVMILNPRVALRLLSFFNRQFTVDG